MNHYVSSKSAGSALLPILNPLRRLQLLQNEMKYRLFAMGGHLTSSPVNCRALPVGCKSAA
jgi:hypothetical protein